MRLMIPLLNLRGYEGCFRLTEFSGIKCVL